MSGIVVDADHVARAAHADGLLAASEAAQVHVMAGTAPETGA